MRKKTKKGFGRWHEERQQKTRKKILDYLEKIDVVEIDDSQRGLRAIQRATSIDITTLRNDLKELVESKKILEMRGENRRRLFCLQTGQNAIKKKKYDDKYEIESKDRTKGKSYDDKEKSKLKNTISGLESLVNAFQIKSSFENERPNNSDSIEIRLNENIIEAIRSALSIMRKLIDSRVATLPQMRSMLSAIESQTSARNAARNYFAKIRTKFIVEPERIGKLVNVRTYQEFVKFIQKDPWNWGFLDMPCPKCNKLVLKTQLNHDGTWDLVCTNFLVHKDELPHFPASLLKKWYEDLRNNTNEAAIKYLQKFRIKV